MPSCSCRTVGTTPYKCRASVHPCHSRMYNGFPFRNQGKTYIQIYDCLLHNLFHSRGVDGVPCNGSIVAPIKRVQICHILLVQLKIINSRIGDDSLRVGAFREGHPPANSPRSRNSTTQPKTREKSHPFCKVQRIRIWALSFPCLSATAVMTGWSNSPLRAWMSGLYACTIIPFF